MNTIIKGLIVSLITIIVVLISIVNIFAIDIETCKKVKETLDNYGMYYKGFNTYNMLESGYNEEVERIIANKLVSLNNTVFIFDIDETVLNNYIGEFLYKSEGINVYNSKWLKKDRLTLGLKHPELVIKKYIKEAINQLLKDGKKVYFITNNMHSKEITETISKLLEIEEPQIIFRSKYPVMEKNMKYKRFNEIAEKENVSIDDIIFIGDDVRDFPNTKIDNFGTKYFLIPQEMYGMQEIYSEKYRKYIEHEIK